VAEPKTRPTDVDVPTFLAAVPDARRRAEGEAVATLMREVTGAQARMWGPSIVGYGTRTYRDSKSNPMEWPRVAFSPRKADLVLYLKEGNDQDPGDAELIARLGPVRTGVSCIYVKRLADLDQGVLRQLVDRVWSRPDAD
jgi:hypothetical protein